MIKVSQEEVLHIAALSRIELAEEEIPGLIKDIEETLTYASRVQEIASGAQEVSSKNINFFRDDIVVQTEPTPILDNVPVREENYVVVPVILE